MLFCLAAAVTVLFALTYSSAGKKAANIERSAIEGVWQIDKRTATVPEECWPVSTPRTSLFVFTAEHFSMMSVASLKPQALFAQQIPPSPEKSNPACHSVTAIAGTYVLADSMIVISPNVSQGPTKVDEVTSYPYHIDADSLWIVYSQGYTDRLVRVE